ncbi:glycine--tRNA ligase [Patescibacteria group bacterium]|nr:glycine--tRNA ligase [Patescibacteria group bacterium]MBU1922442.1 glycine--tRNA ligase [Patescibacteria group bacterium]
MAKTKENSMEKFVSFCKRRGFIFQSSEIYGGFSSCYDYGPLGVELKNNVKRAWWRAMVQENRDIVGLDASILMSPKVWQASGHLTEGFADPMVECKKCHKRFRPDHLEDKKRCPECGGELTGARQFNLMMKTSVGPVEDTASEAYLRAETCQGIYMNFENVRDSMRLKIPFGIAQIGKAFRNEITPGNFTFRMREFEQMEMQYFTNPKEKARHFKKLKEARLKWYLDLGIEKKKLKFHEQTPDELAHYSKAAFDIEYEFPFGVDELEGIHDRGDWDLSNHSEHSKQDLRYFDDQTKEKYFPHVIETSAGADRAALTFLLDAFSVVHGGRTKTTESAKEEEFVLKIDKRLAPIKVAILPLSKKPELAKPAQEIFDELKQEWQIQYDETGSIGRRYRRQDEIGTPYCVTFDFDSPKDKAVTVRDRDTMEQERVKIDELKIYFREKLGD